MEDYCFIITFVTELGGKKQVRIPGANPDMDPETMQDPIGYMIAASIFDREKVGRLINVDTLVLEKVTETVYEF